MMETEVLKSTEDLPDEVLEYILGLVSPYKDLDRCKLVCKRWHRLSKSVCQLTKNNLQRAIRNSSIVWKAVPPQETPAPITKRYSHSACYHGSYLYVFGGCTSTCTTFNDLWTLELNSRQWLRPLTAGTYPSPKASATLVTYNNTLILFGGWTHPSPYPLHQALRLFNELHVYDIVSNRWNIMHFPLSPPPVAGHSATVQGNVMVVFGGLQKTHTLCEYSSSNDVWCLDLTTYNWTKQVTTEMKPSPRYGQSQISLDENRILILGGCGGLHLVLDDMWLLTITESVWIWEQVKVLNSQWAAPHIWCHPSCKVDDLVVIFSKSLTSPVLEPLYSSCCNMRHTRSNVTPPSVPLGIPAEVIARQASNTSPLIEKDVNSNGQHGFLNNRKSDINSLSRTNEWSSPSTSRSSDFNAPSTSRACDFNVPSTSRTSDFNAPSTSRASDFSGASTSRTSDHNVPSTSRGDIHESHTELGSSQMFSSSLTEKRKASCESSRHALHLDIPVSSDDRVEHTLNMAAFRDEIPNRKQPVSKNRMKQLESLVKMEAKYKILKAEKQQKPPEKPPDIPIPQPGGNPNNKLCMYVLDISELKNNLTVSWLQPKVSPNAPRDTILHSVTLGRGEIMIFGGIQKDPPTTTAFQTPSHLSAVSNSLHFVVSPQDII